METNKVFINNDGILEIIIKGDQHVDNFKDIIEQTNETEKNMILAGKPLKTLVNINDMGEVDKSIIYEALQSILERNYYRTAIYGEYSKNSVLMHLLSGIGKFNYTRFKYFKSKSDAIAWLNEPKK